ncbi:MAG: glycosyltransferase family 9 protein [Proteobacteria bacterium]|nr:glycosyltransferase family 9 protein [Pseudomonadota bacterium]
MSIVIQTSFLGDAILSLPFLHEILRLESDHHVWIAAPRNKAIIELALQRGLKNFDHRVTLVEYDKKKYSTPWSMYNYSQNLIKKFPDQKRIYCLQRSFRNGLLSFFTGLSERVGFSTGSASYFYTECVRREWDGPIGELEKNLELLRHHYGNFPAWSPDSAPSLLREIGKQRDYQKGTLALSLTSPWPTKQWDLVEAQELVKNLIKEGWDIYLLGDAKSADFNKQISQSISSKLLHDLSGQTPIKEWVDRIDQCEILVSGDSAAVHVASDLKVPVLSIFGPTHPSFGFAPWRKNAKVIGVELACRPCHIHGPKQCPLKHHNCMKLIKAQDIYRAIEELRS